MIEEKESIIRDLEKELENKDNTQEENEKLKEEINNLLLKLNQQNKYNISDSEKEQVMKKNHDLIVVI